MKRTTKNLLGVAGVISTVLGVFGIVPSFLREQMGLAMVSALFVIGGIILLAIAFGD